MLNDTRSQRILTEFFSRDRRPTGVMIQVSAKCNLGCTMCGYVGRTPNVGFIDTALFHHILEDCRSYGVGTIYLETAWGEPMLHPKIFDLLELTAGLNVILSTNITPLNARRIDRLAEAGLGTLQLSFAGFDRESYEATYIGAKFEHVVENLCRIRAVFPRRSPKTKLLVNGVSVTHDVGFVAKTVRFLRSVGFRDDEMEIKLPNNFGGLYTGSPREPSHEIHTFKDLRGVPIELCSILLNNPGVYVDGRVTACGCLDNSSALVIGNIRTETLRDMRYRPRFEALLKAFMIGDIADLPLCATCDVPYCSSRMITFDPAQVCADPESNLVTARPDG